MLQKYNTWTVARVFFDSPQEQFSLKEVSRRARLAHTSVKNHLGVLMKEGIIIRSVKKLGTRQFPVYTAKADGDAYRRYRSLDVVERIHASGLVQHIVERTSPGCVILFGSASRGEDTEASDIDLYVQARKKDLDLKRYELLLKRKIELHFNEYFRSYPKELRNSIANGIKVHGTLDIE